MRRLLIICLLAVSLALCIYLVARPATAPSPPAKVAGAASSIGDIFSRF